MPFHYLLTNLLVDVPSAIGAIFLFAPVPDVKAEDDRRHHLAVESVPGSCDLAVQSAARSDAPRQCTSS